jgi:hypothetical protein
MVKDEVLSQAKGVITDEQWGDLKIADGVASIQLTASVSPEAVDNAVCSVIKANHDPKIAVVMVEKFGDESQPWVAGQAERGRIEAMLTESLMQNCFTIVEPGIKVTEVAANGDLPQDMIEQIVKNAKAQYVLLGKGAVVKSDKKGTIIGKSKMNSYSLSASVRLLNTQTNVVDAIATRQEQVLAISADHALKGQGENKNNVLVQSVMDDLFQKITERWASDLVNAGKVAVTVKGLKNYASVKDFRSGVESSLRGSKVTQRTLRDGVAELDVEFEGGADAFAAAIDQKKFGKNKVEVLEVAPGKVVLQLN